MDSPENPETLDSREPYMLATVAYSSLLRDINSPPPTHTPLVEGNSEAYFLQDNMHPHSAYTPLPTLFATKPITNVKSKYNPVGETGPAKKGGRLYLKGTTEP